MKRIRVLLLTLVLSVSMLAPEFSMLSDVYAQDETPALAQTVDSVEGTGAPASGDAVDSASAGTADTANKAGGGDRSGNADKAGGGDRSASAGTADTANEAEGGDRSFDATGDRSGNPDTALLTSGTADTANEAGGGDRSLDASDSSADPDAAPLASGDAGSEDTATGSEAGPDSAEAGADQATEAGPDSAAVNGSDQDLEAGSEEGGQPADKEEGQEGEEPADPEGPTAEFGSYDKLIMTELYDAKALVISEDLQDKITVTPTEDGKGLLLSGTVGDLRSAYINIAGEFDFTQGNVGRFSFDGLKDKDRGMDVAVDVYLDDCKSPTISVPLKKQMGSQEWSNKGEKSLSLGSEIDGEQTHTVALRLNITGKKDTAKTTVLFRSMQFCKTTVPVMYFNIDESEGTIDAMNNSEDHSVECYGTVDLIIPETFNKLFEGEFEPQESLEGLDLEYIRGRGNSTWSDDKKPYKVKFDKGQNFFGFGKNKHWVLLANRYDNSLIRNRMTYWLGRELGMEYTPECVPVEVVMNGEYYGSYLLCEQIRVGEGRVTIDDLDDEDPLAITDPLIETGGYLLSMDYPDDEYRTFTTNGDMNLYIESPDDNVKYFHEYIKAFTQKVEDAILSEDFTYWDEAAQTKKPYTELLDLNAAVDYWWVQEFSCNGDAYGSGSTYLYKKRDSETEQGRIYWGPLWDFDFVAWGDLEYDRDPYDGLDYTETPWFNAMKADPVFLKAVKERWQEEGGLKDKMEEITKESGLLDKYIKQTTTTYEYDHALWGPYDSELTEYSAEIEQLRGWINKRIEFVDAEVSKISTEPHTVTFKVDGKVVDTAEVIGVLRKADFPKDPVKKGMVFQSWVDDDYIDYYAGSRVTEDLILNATFISESDIVHAKNIYFKQYEIYYPIFEDSGAGFEEWYCPDYQVMPYDAYETDITWSSSDKSIAKPDEYGNIRIYGKGDVTITAKLKNGVSRSFILHIIDYSDWYDCQSTALSKTSLTLKEGEYTQILVKCSPQPCDVPDVFWISLNENVATVDDFGIVTAVGPGTTEILAVNSMTREVMRCKVTVPSKGSKQPDKPKTNKGKIVKRKGSTYKITYDQKGKRRAMLIKAKNASKVTIPSVLKYGGKKYSITKIKAKAFAKSKATKVYIKTRKLTRSCVKNALKGSKVKKIYVRVGNKKINKKYVRKYKKLFKKKIAGKTVTVK